jgi:hypothetical protein
LESRRLDHGSRSRRLRAGFSSRGCSSRGSIKQRLRRSNGEIDAFKRAVGARGRAEKARLLADIVKISVNRSSSLGLRFTLGPAALLAACSPHTAIERDASMPPPPDVDGDLPAALSR